jgi:hypothetical protein
MTICTEWLLKASFGTSTRKVGSRWISIEHPANQEQ